MKWSKEDTRKLRVWFLVLFFQVVGSWMLWMLDFLFVTEQSDEQALPLVGLYTLQLRKSVSSVFFGATVFWDSCFPA
jgi:hypothetical protein